MTEVDKKAQPSLVNTTTNGAEIVDVEVMFSGGVTPNDAKVAGQAALIVVSSRDIPSSAVHTALRNGGHSRTFRRGRFTRAVSVNGEPENFLQELPDGTSVHFAEETSPLNEAPKSSLVQPNKITPIRSGRRFVLNVFSTSEDPDTYGLSDIMQEEKPAADKIIPFPVPVEKKPAA